MVWNTILLAYPTDLDPQDRVLLARDLTLTELAERIGVALSNLSILKTNKARAVRFSTPAALGREMDSQPGGLAGVSEEG